jgi:hypothetical protein
VFFYEFVKTEYSRSLTSEVLGQAFGIEPSHVRKIRSKAEKKPKPPYLPAAINENQTAAVVTFIENSRRIRNTLPRETFSVLSTQLPEMSELSMDGFVFEKNM